MMKHGGAKRTAIRMSWARSAASMAFQSCRAVLTEPDCVGNHGVASCVGDLSSRLHEERSMIGLLLGVAALGGGFVTTRDFVKRRLRFVDAAQKRSAPVVAGAAATGAGLLAAALPIITIPMAIAFGVGVGTGWASGQRATSDS